MENCEVHAVLLLNLPGVYIVLKLDAISVYTKRRGSNETAKQEILRARIKLS